METPKTFQFNKGVNRPLEFRGLKGPYIGRLVGSAVGLIGFYAVLRLVGITGYGGVLVTLALGGLVVKRLYRMSRVYGQYGLMKKSARARVPDALRCRSRRVFIQIYSDGTGKVR